MEHKVEEQVEENVLEVGSSLLSPINIDNEALKEKSKVVSFN